jgi:hypothetical protein
MILKGRLSGQRAECPLPVIDISGLTSQSIADRKAVAAQLQAVDRSFLP